MLCLSMDFKCNYLIVQACEIILLFYYLFLLFLGAALIKNRYTRYCCISISLFTLPAAIYNFA